MIKIINMFKYFSFFYLIFTNVLCNYDLTIISAMKFEDGIYRLPIALIDCLKSDLNINFIPTKFFGNSNKNFISKIISQDKVPGKVSILMDFPWCIWGEYYKKVPNSKIKLAYSMLESNSIPKQWVNIFNNYFDAVIVPDDYVAKTYKSSGVIKPIFTIPCPLYLDEFLNKTRVRKKTNNFIFGCSAFFSDSKNQVLLLKAFAQAFNRNSKVKLILHGRFGDVSSLMQIKKSLNLQNVFIVKKSFSQKQYVNFIDSFDCYVLLSKGEGFSITPREAMALGMPCILSNNTAHETICNTGFVKSINCSIPVKAYYEQFKFFSGYKYNCTVKEAAKALKHVYNNYNYYLNKANLAKKWVRQFNLNNIKSNYLTLVKPKKVILGKENKVYKDKLVTSCKKLFAKYKNL